MKAAPRRNVEDRRQRDRQPGKAGLDLPEHQVPLPRITRAARRRGRVAGHRRRVHLKFDN